MSEQYRQVKHTSLENIQISVNNFEEHTVYLIQANFTKGLNIIRVLENDQYLKYKQEIITNLWIECKKNCIKCILIDDDALKLSSEKLVDICKDNDVIVFDKADLYLTERVLKNIDIENKIIIACLKQLSSINKYRMKEYFIKIDNENKVVNLVKY